MPTPPFHIVSFVELPSEALLGLESSASGVFVVRLCVGGGVQALAAAGEPAYDALIVDAGRAAEAASLVDHAAADTATLVVVAGASVAPADALAWWQRGVQDVLEPAALGAASLPMRVRAAIERKRVEREARKAFATDLETGLPHQQQLLEHVSQLLALREREPAPMALLALRIEGLASAEARLGREAAQVLRRKVGVRLRAGVRGSDVVASIGEDSFAVLLGSVLSPADAERVGAKLVQALLEPFQVNAVPFPLAVALGIGHFPQDGSQPDALLRRATGLAAAEPARGRTVPADHPGRVQAANDEAH